jgi:hypothetical protein
MFVTLYDPSKPRQHTWGRVGKTGLRKLSPGFGRIGSRLGSPGIRMDVRSAAEARMAFDLVQRWVALTGYRALIETTKAEDEALFRSRHIDTTSQRHWVK